MLSQRTSLPDGAISRDRGLGPAGLLARVGVGPVFIYLALFWSEVDWLGAVLGLVVMPALVVAALALRARHSPQPLSATGPLGHALNLAVIIPLFAWPATSGAAFLFYGASMLVAAARRAGDCEVSAISNALLKRDDQVGCPLFAPVDAVERAARARRGLHRERGQTSNEERGADRRRRVIAPFAVATVTVVGCAAIPLMGAIAGSLTLAGVVAIAAGLCLATVLLAPLALRRSRHGKYQRVR